MGGLIPRTLDRKAFGETWEGVLFHMTVSGLISTVAQVVAALIWRNPLFYIGPAITVVGIILWTLQWGWDSLNPLVESITVAPEDSETLCRPFIPDVPCNPTTNEETLFQHMEVGK